MLIWVILYPFLECPLLCCSSTEASRIHHWVCFVWTGHEGGGLHSPGKPGEGRDRECPEVCVQSADLCRDRQRVRQLCHAVHRNVDWTFGQNASQGSLFHSGPVYWGQQVSSQTTAAPCSIDVHKTQWYALYFHDCKLWFENEVSNWSNNFNEIYWYIWT